MNQTPDNRQQRQQELAERQKILKELIMRLHQGAPEAEIQEAFNTHFSGVSAYEIQAMEKGLLAEGISIEEIMSLCNVHANLLKDAVMDPKTSAEVEQPGHPVQVLKAENLAIEATLDRIERLLQALQTQPDEGLHRGLMRQLTLLGQFDHHYVRKEYCFFPIMERYGMTAPPQVMWGVDDTIRDLYREVLRAAEQQEAQLDSLFEKLKHELQGMMVKEEDILVPMVLGVFNEDDWLRIAQETPLHGYCIVQPEAEWKPHREPLAEQARSDSQEQVALQTGYLTPKELNLMLNHLPLELSFVDADNVVKYYNEGLGEEKVFPRTPSAIGRDVMNCHPPRVHRVVSQLLEELRTGKKDQEQMWFKRGDQFVHVTYRAVRDQDGTFCGTLEYVQNIQPFFDLTRDEKRQAD